MIPCHFKIEILTKGLKEKQRKDVDFKTTIIIMYFKIINKKINNNLLQRHVKNIIKAYYCLIACEFHFNHEKTMHL